MKYCSMNLFILLFIILFQINICKAQEGVLTEYVNMINQSLEDASNFKFPQNAYEYKTRNDSDIKEYGIFDIVIIGAGISGSVIANRLSEVRGWKVLLIEAGDYSDGDFIKIPGFFRQHAYSKYNWQYPTVPQKNICLGNPNQTCPIISGKGVGGGSLINGLVYCRGPPDTYNKLAKSVNDSSWNYENTLYYFKKSEHFEWRNKKAPIDLSYHGNYGLLQVEHGLPDSILNQPFFETNEEMGYKVIDYNGPNMIGTTYIQRNSRNGTREDFGSTFVTPFLGRQSLNVSEHSYVTKIEIDKVTKKAVSVLFSKHGQIYRARATKEVVLSAGSVASPQILMLSGVGPEDHLKELNIPVIKNLAVGQKLKDHVIILIPFSSDFKYHQPSLREQLKQYLNGYGLLSFPPSVPQVLGFYQLNKTESKIPDMEIFILVFQDFNILRQGISKDENTTIFYMGVEYFPIKSIGQIRLKSNNPYDYPIIDPNYLNDESNEDIEGLYKTVEFILKLTRSTAYKKYNVSYLKDSVSVCSGIKDRKKYWYCVIKQTAIPGLHIMGTCPMGTDPSEGAVVNSNLQVFGIKNLRVADASVYPEPIEGHSTAPCLMLGEKISDTIKKHYGKPVYLT